MANPPSHAGTGPVNCSNPAIAGQFNDTQDFESCHVCLSTGAVIGLVLHAQAGLVSLLALLILLLVIVRNYRRNLRNPALGEWRLFRGNVDILMLNLVIADILMSFGAISDIHWVQKRQVYCGKYCDAQGVLQTAGETAAALSTLAVAVYTFFTVNFNRRLPYRPWVCLGVVVVIWLWVLLWSLLLLTMYNDPGVAGPGETGDVLRVYTPTPWWCWISGRYMAIRIIAEYLWLWIAGIFTIVLYVPAYCMVRNRQPRPQPARNNRLGAAQQSVASGASTIDEDNEAVKLLWYPLAYTFCVLPLSIIRWAGFAHPQLLDRPEIMPTSMVFSSIFNLMGLINVVLIFWTRPAILLVGEDGCFPSRGSLDGNGGEIPLPPVLPRAPDEEPRQQDQHGGESPNRMRPSASGFGGQRVGIPRDEF